MEKFNEIKSLVSSMEADAEKFYNQGNKAASSRYRNALLSLKQLSHEERKNVVEKRKS